MNERITLVSLFDQINLSKINAIINKITMHLCKVPFGKNVDDRMKADTLPFHFTIFSWSIEKEKEVKTFLNNMSFTPFKVLVQTIEIVNGNEDSFELRFCIEKSENLEQLQNYILNHYSSKYYNPTTFHFHITIHIDKDYKIVKNMQEILLQDFAPFELEINTLGLFTIWPAQLVKEVKATPLL